jgi:hypothetical protein
VGSTCRKRAARADSTDSTAAGRRIVRRAMRLAGLHASHQAPGAAARAGRAGVRRSAGRDRHCTTAPDTAPCIRAPHAARVFRGRSHASTSGACKHWRTVCIVRGHVGSRRFTTKVRGIACVRTSNTETRLIMKYGIAWLIGIPPVLIVGWFLLNHC